MWKVFTRPTCASDFLFKVWLRFDPPTFGFKTPNLLFPAYRSSRKCDIDCNLNSNFTYYLSQLSSGMMNEDEDDDDEEEDEEELDLNEDPFNIAERFASGDSV
jgi:hypothetical protein